MTGLQIFGITFFAGVLVVLAVLQRTRAHRSIKHDRTTSGHFDVVDDTFDETHGIESREWL